MDKGSRKYLTVNSNKDLLQPSRLQYGIHSAIRIFQREMEKRLGHVPFTVLRMEDILISGKNDNEHFQNSDVVLDIVFKNVVFD